MSLFIDKHKRRKSPIALAAFGAALLEMLVFGGAYALLAEPLYRAVRLEGAGATTVIHALIIAGAGTAVCCLLFLLPDKRVAPYGFAGLGVALMMFYGAALMLGEDVRGGMLRLITMYGLAPVVLGNAVAWTVYRRLRRTYAPAPPKTLREELRQAAARQEKAQPAPRAAAKEPPVPQTPPAPPKTAAQEPPAPKAPPPPPETRADGGDAALFGPGEGTGPGAASPFRTAQEEAMLFYDDEENDD